jgi:hypothetical protein
MVVLSRAAAAVLPAGEFPGAKADSLQEGLTVAVVWIGVTRLLGRVAKPPFAILFAIPTAPRYVGVIERRWLAIVAPTVTIGYAHQQWIGPSEA